jgi:hypothetical protein
MSYSEPLSQQAIAISISDSTDLARLGLSEEHLRDAMVEVARHLLAMGARLVYGGDVRANGFTELLFELVARYRRDADIGDDRLGVVSYLAWPVVASKPAAEWRQLTTDLAGVAEVHCLDRVGVDVALDDLPSQPLPAASDDEWAESLTAMRGVLTAATHARIVLGGRTTSFKGSMPGIAEETLLAIRAGQPVYVMGGFGGCAGDIAHDLKLLAAPQSAPTPWPCRSEFAAFTSASLNNGLDAAENQTLARTAHVDEAIALILRGLLRVAGGATPAS